MTYRLIVGLSVIVGLGHDDALRQRSANLQKNIRVTVFYAWKSRNVPTWHHL
jgi:hypothetical protein